MEAGNSTRRQPPGGSAGPADTGPARPAPASRSGIVLALQARAWAHERFQPAAHAVVTELALRLACERVSIGFAQAGRLRVAAVSGAADLAERQDIVRAIAAAMEEALEQRLAIFHPLPPGSAPTVSLAHGELSRANGQASILTVPIAGDGRVLGAIVFERADGFDARSVEVATDAAAFVGPILELKHRIDQPIGGRLIDAVAPRHARGEGRFGLRPRHGLALALVAGALAVVFWPATFRVIASARVDGDGQRVISAPADGFVRRAVLRPGAVVVAGQVLAALEDRDLVLERDKWATEAAQFDKQYREAQTRDEAAPVVIARSKLEQAQAQLEMVERQIERAQLRAPFDGVLVAGDLSQSIGMPVKRGQELLTVAPDRAFRIVAEVDEQDVSLLREGQRIRVLFGAWVDRPIEATVTRIAPVATQSDGRNVFEVDARIDGEGDARIDGGAAAHAKPAVDARLGGSAAALRPGLRGVARIDIDERTVGRIGWHRAVNWSRRILWQWLG